MALTKEGKQYIVAALHGYTRHKYYRVSDSGDNDYYLLKMKEVDAIITKLEGVK
jgi:hypothetical protein